MPLMQFHIRRPLNLNISSNNDKSNLTKKNLPRLLTDGYSSVANFCHASNQRNRIFCAYFTQHFRFVLLEEQDLHAL